MLPSEFDIAKTSCCICGQSHPVQAMSLAATYDVKHVCQDCQKGKGLEACQCCGRLDRAARINTVHDMEVCHYCSQYENKYGRLPSKPKPESQSHSEELPCGICGEPHEKYTTLKQSLCEHLPKVKHSKICYDCYGTRIRFDPSRHRYEMGVDLKEAEACECCGQWRRKTKFVDIRISRQNQLVYRQLTQRFQSEGEAVKVCKWCYEEKLLRCDDCHGDFLATERVLGTDLKYQCTRCWKESHDVMKIDKATALAGQAKQLFQSEKEQSSMSNAMSMDRMMGGSLGPDTSGKFKASMMGIAIKNSEGIYCIYDGTQMVDVMDFIMPGFGDVFKLPTTDVEIGDLILHQGEAHYVRDVNEDKTIEVLNPFTSKVERLMPTKNLMGFKFFVKIVSMSDMFGFGKMDLASDNPFGNMGQMMMVSMILGGGGDGKSNPMSGMFGGGSDATNPFGGMMGAMMMSQMFGGKSEGNPMSNLFGGFLNQPSAQKSKPARKTKAEKEAEKEPQV